MNKKTILITGGTGMIGTALANHFSSNGYSIIILTRNSAKAKTKSTFNENVSFADWDIERQTVDVDAVAKADTIIHLAGAGVVAKPWTEAYKKEIVESRTKSSALIVKALKEISNKVETVISASAIGYYGADKNELAFTETDKPVRSFLGETCRLWEESIRPVTGVRKRLVIYRTGIVLSKHGGALEEFKKPLKFRVAAVLGNGKQVVSWIHIDDLCSLYQYAIENPDINGVYNAVAPKPVSNKELTITLAKAMHGNSFIAMPVPVFVLKIMLGGRSIEVLKSATVSSAKIQEAGFKFEYGDIEKAIGSLV